MEFVPDPVTVTPPAATAKIVPLPAGTERVTVIAPTPASTSATDSPVSLTGTSSFVAKEVGSELTGASFNDVTLTVATAVFEFAVPSVTTTLMVRGVVDGESVVF